MHLLGFGCMYIVAIQVDLVLFIFIFNLLVKLSVYLFDIGRDPPAPIKGIPVIVAQGCCDMDKSLLLTQFCCSGSPPFCIHPSTGINHFRRGNK